MKKICIDARLWGIGHTGIGRYIESLIDHLPKDDKYQITLIVPKSLLSEPKLQRFELIPALFHPYSLLSQFEMLFLLSKIKPHLLHVTHFTIPVLWFGKMVVTIHDLIKHHSRGTKTTTRHPLLYWLKYLGYLFLVRIAVYKSSHIIVPANFWRQDIINRYSLPAGKITTIYEGVDHSRFVFHPVIHPQPTIIYTGNAYPHKNLPVLVRSLKLLPDSLRLVIVCSRGIFQDRISKLASQLSILDRITFLSRVPDSELSQLYSHSLAFVTPSLIEGFGLPGLEAMAAGTPVIAANASCLPEIYGKAALFFDPASPTDLAQKIMELSTDHKRRKQLIDTGLIQSQKYSWDKMAQQTWSIYLNVLP